MSSGKILGAILVIGAFAGGTYFGNSQNSAPVITKSSGGASYGGGYDQSTDSDAKSAKKSDRIIYKSEVADRSIQGSTIVVNDGESIMAAVQNAKPGDTIQVMPGTYHET
ncbi:MAG: cytochrome-c peroxidase, partial [Colwelliaceae bacterium]|nr:cytochrome-c peroxidase [Colwelliaceae bacterium]